MPAIALVACAAGKLPRAAPARDLYTSQLFVKARAYAESVADRWYILSALHGLVDPAAVIAPYNVTLNTMRAQERAAWGARVTAEIVAAAPAGSDLIMLAGESYRAPLIPHLSGYHIITPLAGLGIGRQLAWLTARAPQTYTQGALL